MNVLRSVFAVLVCLFGFSLSAGAASAAVGIQIDLSTQRMQVVNEKGERFDWAISSGRSGFNTPRGAFKPYSLRRMHYSRKYQMAPMPHSIFFLGGYAIHGTSAVRQLGRPASHGCIRLAPGHAAKLFAMVQKEGASITIAGSPPNQNVASKADRAARMKIAAAKRLKNERALAARESIATPMAFAPVTRAPGVRAWQAAPLERTYPGN
jgi:hypothetical protein